MTDSTDDIYEARDFKIESLIEERNARSDPSKVEAYGYMTSKHLDDMCVEINKLLKKNDFTKNLSDEDFYEVNSKIFFHALESLDEIMGVKSDD